MSLDQPDKHTSFRNPARYGVPLLILVFYVTAAFHFSYTLDSTYGVLVRTQSEGFGSLWQLLLSAGMLLKINGVIAAKVFSLLFTSVAILLGFLIAHEVLRSRLLAFCAALTFSMQAWMLQLAPSGSGISLALVLCLVAIFFLLRNEYIVATIASALAALVVWQAVLLILILLLDASINSREPDQRRRLLTMITMIFVSIILPWFFYCVYVSRVIIPNELVDSSAELLSLPVLFEVVLYVGLMFAAVVLMASRHRMALRVQSPLILWIVIASFAHRQMFVITLPLIIIYAFFAVHVIIETFGRKNLGSIGVLVFTGLSLAYNQFVVWPATRSGMDATVIVNEEIRATAEWLRLYLNDDDAIQVPSGHEGLVQFYSGRPLGGDGAQYLISNIHNVEGYAVAYDPLTIYADAIRGPSHYRVWRRK